MIQKTQVIMNMNKGEKDFFFNFPRPFPYFVELRLRMKTLKAIRVLIMR